MFRFIILSILLAAPACDGPGERVINREAPDVPWPSVDLEGQVKSPDYVGAVLADCFAAELGIDHSAPTLVHYEDQVPDGDDQQPAELCVSWSAHLDLGDCVRRGLLKLGATVQQP